MKIKSYMLKDVKTCTEKETVVSAAKIMSTHNIGSIVVVKDDTPIGIFTERDLVKRVVARGKNPTDITVGEVMTKELFTIGVDKRVGTAYHVFVINQIRHLPVVENGRLVGIVSIKDIAKAVDDKLIGMYYDKFDFSGDY